MGCCSSNLPVRAKQSSVQRGLGLRAPVLLFYLPGSSKETLLKQISEFAPNNLSNSHLNVSPLNVRFIDVANQRSSRKNWPKEFATKTDVCLSLYLADIRSKPDMLINVKTLNWFLLQTFEKYRVYTVVISSNTEEVETFKSLLSCEPVLLIINVNQPETVKNFCNFINVEVAKYNDTRKK